MKEKLMLSNKQARKNLHFRISVFNDVPGARTCKIIAHTK